MVDQQNFVNYLPEGCTLEDYLSLAAEDNPEKAITYKECAEVLESEICRRHPQLDFDQFYRQVREDLRREGQTSAQAYCRKLVEVEEKLRTIS